MALADKYWHYNLGKTSDCGSGIQQLIWCWGVCLSNLTGILELFLSFSWTLGSLYVMTRFYPNMPIELNWSWIIICWWRSFFGHSSILIASSSFVVNWSGLIKLSSNLFHPAFVIFIPSLQYYHHRSSIWLSHFWYKPVSSLPNS